VFTEVEFHGHAEEYHTCLIQANSLYWGRSIQHTAPTPEASP
jgi:hypothetical protein